MQNNMNNGYANTYQNTQTMYGSTDYNELAVQSNNKFAIIALVMSIISLILSCFGAFFGIIIQIVIYYFGYKGINSQKKGMAIAAIVVNSVALVITLIMIVIAVIGS
jgi:hypothetical protein